MHVVVARFTLHMPTGFWLSLMNPSELCDVITFTPVGPVFRSCSLTTVLRNRGLPKSVYAACCCPQDGRILVGMQSSIGKLQPQLQPLSLRLPILLY